MVFSFNRLTLQSVSAAALIALASLKGGRTTEGTAIFLTVSALLFFITFRRYPLPKTDIDPFVIGSLTIAMTSAAHELPSGFRGVALLSLLAAYAANFYIFLQLKGKELCQKISITIMTISLVLSAGIAAQWTADEMRYVFFPNNNLLISFLNCGVLTVLYLWHKCHREEPVGFRNRFTYGLVFGASLALLLAAELRVYSIGGAVALAAGLAAFALLNKIKAPRIYAAAFVAALLGALLFPHLAKGFMLKAGIVLENYRLQIWQSGWQAFLEKPLFGWGLGNFEIAYQVHRLPIDSLIGRYGQTTAFAHNELIQVAVELGILGLAASIIVLAAAAREVFLTYHNGMAQDYHHWALSCIAMLLVHGFFDFNLHLPILGLLLMFFCAQFVRTQNSFRGEAITNSLSAAMIVLFATYFAAMTYILALNRKTGNARPPDIKEQSLRSLPRMDPMNHQPHADLARFLYAENRLEESLMAYHEAIERSPKDPFYLAEAGDIFIITNRMDLARPYYLSAVQLEPLYAFGHYRLGEIDLALKNIPSAQNSFMNALRITEAALAPSSDYERRLIDLDARIPRERMKMLPLQ